MTDHDRLHELTAAYVLGALDADDRAALESHLESCDECRRDVVRLAPLPALLGRVDPATAWPDTPPADAVVDAIRADVRDLARSRRRWRRAAGAAAAVVLLGASGLFLAADGGGEDERWGDGVVLAIDRANEGTTATVVADEQRWGTYVYVSAEGLPAADVYELWVVEQGGAWHAAGTWAPTEDGRADLGGSTRFPLDQIEQVVVTVDGRSRQILSAS